MKKKHFLVDITTSLVFSLETALVVYFLLLDTLGTRGKIVLCLCVVLSFPVCLLLCRFCRKVSRLLIAGLALLLLCLAIGFGIFLSKADYRDAGTDRSDIFAGHRVMVIVPHEDDDINVFGGLFEEYRDGGSEVYTVFVTNGDYSGIGELRIEEAIRCMALCGVPEDHVIFLGYGDQWDETGAHIYNVPPGTVTRSYIGYTETYATDDHPPFRKSAYTSENYLRDMKDVIHTYQPDTIFCVDHDDHVDHQAASFAFEKVLGQLLREETDYRPTVLKGFAYSTAWTAPSDFYSLNILSATNPETGGDYMPDASCYRWDSRLRLPVSTSALSRSIRSSSVFRELDAYTSKRAFLKAPGVINGDKVFWERSTASLSYTAQIRTSSGNAGLLNDFMLYDDGDLVRQERSPADGVWIPEESDAERSATVVLDHPSDIGCLYLYDNPSETDNVLDAEIRLDNGTTIDTGALDKFGAPTCINIGEEGVSSLTIVLKSTEGAYAGLTEAEIYDSVPAGHFHFIKLMDEQENFAYDYAMPEEMNFYLYTAGDAPALSCENYTVECSCESCRAEIVGDHVEVICPPRTSCRITVMDTTGRYSDSIFVSNRQNLIPLWQRVDRKIFLGLYSYLSRLL